MIRSQLMFRTPSIASKLIDYLLFIDAVCLLQDRTLFFADPLLKEP
jgi:hypothetical protein